MQLLKSKKVVQFLIKANIILKKFANVEKIIVEAITIWPSDVDLMMVALKFYASVYNNDALYRTYAHLERIHPDTLAVKRGLAFALASSYRYEDAIPNFLYCIENWVYDENYNAPLANIHARLALCYLFLEKQDLATSHLTIAEEMEPLDLDVMYCKLLRYLETGELGKLETLLDHRIKQHPYLYVTYYWKGLYTRDYLHDIPKALYWYQQAFRNMNRLQRDFLSHFSAVNVYGDIEDMVKDAAEAYVQLRQFTKAKWLIIFTKLRRWEIDTRALLIYLDILAGDYKVAQEKCKRILKKKPYLGLAAEYWMLLALAQYKLGQLENSLTNINQSLLLDPEAYDAWKILGSIQVEKQDWGSAINTFRRILSMNRFDYKSWHQIAICYRAIGDKDSAQDALGKMLRPNL